MVVVVLKGLFRVLLLLLLLVRKIRVVIVDASLLLIFLLVFLCTIVIVLWYCGRIQGRVQGSIVVVGCVQASVFSLCTIGARNELGECSKCIDCLVNPVVPLMTQHHLCY